jgi:HSP20 family protein
MVMERWRPTKAVIPWSPFREIEDLEQRMSQFMDWPSLSLARRFLVEGMEWSPVVDMYEKENQYIVKAEIPGMKEEDIAVSISDNTLYIKGERKDETATEEEGYHFTERSYGKFFRAITLPLNLSAKDIKADYENGVLEVRIPKAEEAKPRKVTVRSKK